MKITQRNGLAGLKIVKNLRFTDIEKCFFNYRTLQYRNRTFYDDPFIANQVLESLIL